MHSFVMTDVGLRRERDKQIKTGELTAEDIGGKHVWPQTVTVRVSWGNPARLFFSDKHT